MRPFFVAKPWRPIPSCTCLRDQGCASLVNTRSEKTTLRCSGWPKYVLFRLGCSRANRGKPQSPHTPWPTSGRSWRASGQFRSTSPRGRLNPGKSLAEIGPGPVDTPLDSGPLLANTGWIRAKLGPDRRPEPGATRSFVQLRAPVSGDPASGPDVGLARSAPPRLASCRERGALVDLCVRVCVCPQSQLV